MGELLLLVQFLSMDANAKKKVTSEASGVDCLTTPVECGLYAVHAIGPSSPPF